MLHNGKSKSRTSRFTGMTLIYTIEPFKDPLLIFLCNSDSGICHRYHCPSVSSAGNRHFDLTVLAVVLDRIVAEIVDHLIENLPCTFDPAALSSQCHLHLLLLCPYGKMSLDITADLHQIHFLHRDRLVVLVQSGQLDNILDKRA